MEYKYLVCVKANENNYKYYSMTPKGDMFEVKYGRVGNSNYQTCTYPASQFDKKYNEKIKKGYVDKTELKAELVEEIKEQDSPLAEIQNRSVALIIKRLQDFANNTIKANYTVSQAEVTQAMIDEAQDILSAMVEIDNLDEFNEQLLKLMAVIPRKVKRVKDYLPKVLEEIPNIVQNEQDLLDTMAGQIYKKPENNEEKDLMEDKERKTKTILDEMGIEMSETDESDIKLIKKAMGDSADKFYKAWRVNNKETEQIYQKFIKENNIGNIKLLCHGSKNQNWFNIIRAGLKIRPTGVVTTGAMWGLGEYWSNPEKFHGGVKKSIGYTSLNGYWTREHQNCGFIAFFDVALGESEEAWEHESKYYNYNLKVLHSHNSNYWSLFCHGNTNSLRNDEIIVYTDKQATIRYLVEIR